MERLFHIETDRVTLSFSALAAPPRTAARTGEPGLLRITPLRASLVFGPATFRAGVPAAIAGDPTLTIGPILHEQAQYKLYVRACPGSAVRVIHPDPVFLQQLSEEDGGGTVHGVISFGSQIGRAAFTIAVDGAPELRIELEVFPTKLDYRADYDALLADVQEILTGLALEYLRSTYQLGQPSKTAAPTPLEWILLLRGVIDDLARALEHVARHPVRRLERRTALTRADRVQRASSLVRSSGRRGAGAGPLAGIVDGAPIRARLPEPRPTPTLDTPEHRFLAAQIAQIRRRLADLRRRAARDSDRRGARHRRALDDIAALEARLAALARIEPLAAARGEPPAGFTSLPLLAAPGYREAYRACLILSLGLRIEGGPLDLALKDLSLLYEYWCYLTTVRLLGAITGHPAETRDLFTIRRDGLEVRLAQGRESEVRIHAAGDRRISLRYNPLLDHADALLPQRPDLLLSITDPGWPPQELILDAKYRIDLSLAYRARYGAPGPPEEALHALHRYRDAILEQRGEAPSLPASTTLQRTVVQAAALFPYREAPGEDFAESRLFRALGKLGIGAVPLLPGDTGTLERWLRGALERGPWAIADRALDHASVRRAASFRQRAAEVVLVGALRDRPGPGGVDSAHLAWIKAERRFYVALTPKQRRQHVARWIAIYTPAGNGRRGGVTHVASVEGFTVMTRGEVGTPWPSRGDPAQMVIVYALGPIAPIAPVIENRDARGRGRRVMKQHWSSRLALDRASMLSELALETEPEWRLYEDLRARGAVFRIEAGPARVEDAADPRGRAWFLGQAGWAARYVGAAGFAWLTPESAEVRHLARPEDVAAAVTRAVERAREP